MRKGIERLRVRPAKAEDVDLIVEFNSSLAAESEGLELDRAALRRGVETVIRFPDRGFYLVAESADRVVGQLLVTREWSDWRCGFFWWLQSVYVPPEFRGRGVFRALFDHAVKMARTNRDVLGIRLYVRGDNEAAEKVYANLGMKPSKYRMMEMEITAAPDSEDSE